MKCLLCDKEATITFETKEDLERGTRLSEILSLHYLVSGVDIPLCAQHHEQLLQSIKIYDDARQSQQEPSLSSAFQFLVQFTDVDFSYEQLEAIHDMIEHAFEVLTDAKHDLQYLDGYRHLLQKAVWNVEERIKMTKEVWGL